MTDFHINHFGIEKPGDQPIRVFYNQIEIEFEEIQKLLINRFQNQNLNNLKLSFLTENIQPIGPNVNRVRIELHDTFLSFLWSYCYGTIITTPRGKSEFNAVELDKARGLLNYAKELMFIKFITWPTILPNPENLETHYKDNVAITNAVFMCAVIIILFHEFGHVVLGHIENSDRSIANMRKMENEADAFAIEEFLKIPSFNEKTKNSAIICAIGSLAFGKDKFNNTGFHPEPEDRLTHCLELLNYPEDNLIWASASWPFIEWQIYFGLFFKGLDLSSHKNTYKGLIEDLKEYKKTK